MSRVWPAAALCVSLLALTHQNASCLGIKECKRSPFGFDYMGNTSTTKSGKQCQSWSSQTPHPHKFTSQHHFPDASMKDVSSHCRNPDDKFSGPWCFTTDPDVQWEHCNIPFCHAYPECYRLAGGTDCHGSRSQTKSGKFCKNWSDLSPVELTSLLDNVRQSDIPLEDHNYCRNHDDKEAPWCFIQDEENLWEYCDVPPCKPSANCRSTITGSEYSGTISQTRMSVPCQRWDRQAPHHHTFDASKFPDDSLLEAANFCRNPDNKEGGPWCYTVDPRKEWDYCNIPLCKDCKSSESGWEYSGTLAITADGKDCEPWISDGGASHPYADDSMFPDADVEAASNFCRNPTGSRNLDGPWCYTDASKREWGYCSVPHCTDRKVPRTPIAKHVVYIGIDGLKPSCLLDAPEGAMNIMERLAKKGISTLTKATGILRTISIPSWHSALCGLGPEHTGVLDNDWLPPWQGNPVNITPITGNDVPLPCIFQELKSRDENIRTAYFYSWDNFKIFGNRGYPGYVDWEYSSEGEDRWDLQDKQVVGNATAYLRNILKAADRSMTFIWLVNVDDNGHSFGWCSKEYLAAIDEADKQVDQLLDVIDDLGISEDVLVVLSADHGGEGTGHGRMTDDDLRIPMFLRGPGIPEDVTFTHQVSLSDVTPTIFRALGLPPSPWWTGRVMDSLWDDYGNQDDPLKPNLAHSNGPNYMILTFMVMFTVMTKVAKVLTLW